MKTIVPLNLETKRLQLRMFEEKDWDDLFQMFKDEECVRYTIKTPLTKWQTWRTLAGYLGHWYLRGYGPYAVVEKSSGKMMGPVGLWFPGDWPEPEIKWSFAREFCGKGYATEAAIAVREMARDVLKRDRLISLILPENEPSKRSLLKLGLSMTRLFNFVMALLRSLFMTSNEPKSWDDIPEEIRRKIVFQGSAGSPVTWWSKANSLREAGRVLINAKNEWHADKSLFYRAISSRSNSREIVAVGLIAMALENLFKSIISGRISDHVVDGELNKKLRGHRLDLLAKEADVQFQKASGHDAVLKKLSNYIIWFSRYPTPLKEENVEEIFFEKQDYAKAEEIYSILEKKFHEENKLEIPNDE
ncbi:MAG: GNAT family N-acetyltransferase [Bacteriovoracia bacterium]